MRYLPGRRELALVAALAFATAGSAFAQDTTDMGRAPMDTIQPAAGALDTAGVDSSGVQNPPGYRGMERDTTTDSVPDDTSGGDENDAYRSERSAASDSAAHDSMQHRGAGIGDTTTQ